jgi:hypothetical protein
MNCIHLITNCFSASTCHKYYNSARAFLFEWAKTQFEWPSSTTLYNNGKNFRHGERCIRVVLVGDNTEQQVPEYSDRIAENSTFSGKYMSHTFTRFHACAPSGKCYYASKSFNGAMNDQQTYNLINLDERLGPNEGFAVDLGYNGIKGDNIIKKRQGKLDADDKWYNAKVDKIRVVIENHFGYLQDWHILKAPFRFITPKNGSLDDILQMHHEYWIIATALYNEFASPLRKFGKNKN